MPSSPNLPICYTFRRCPYAMRARMALDYSGIAVEYREIVLRNKPPSMLAASPKGTVPVLMDTNGQVLDESLAIMQWCLQQTDTDNWLDAPNQPTTDALIHHNDHTFKHWLDHYKYAVRFPEQTERYYRQQAEVFIQTLEDTLQTNPWLAGARLTRLDVAIFPFIRQFSMVDSSWFAQANYPQVKRWLQHFLTSPRFQRIMIKRPVWKLTNATPG